MSAEQIILQLLEQRGIPAAEQSAFCHPDFTRDIPAPTALKGLELAVSRLQTARKNHEKVIVVGDYDADGIPATALFLRVARALKWSKVEGVIPTRAQGYGLTMELVAELVKRQPKVVVTLDNGTVSAPEVAALTKAGIDVIVIDHHEPQEGKVAEAALAIINPKQADCTYPFRELCACALTWKVLWALAEYAGEDPQFLKWELDLVAISTIADMVPLVGENRVLAHYGLQVLRKSRNLGLQALANVAGMRLNQATAGDVGFKLAPRLNAPSRMHEEILDGTNASLSLLVADSKTNAETCAEYLNEQNSARQRLVEQHLEQAEAQVGAAETKVIVAYHEGWSTGVIGLVAGRLMDKYRRPVIALAKEGDSIKGSVRSVDGVHALELLEAASAQLERFGGHAKAAGLTLNGSVLDFQKAVESYMHELGLSIDELVEKGKRSADLEVALSDLDLGLAEQLITLEPFGIGFSTPLFQVRAQVSHARKVGAQQQHLSCFLVDGAVQRKGIAFQYHGPELEEGVWYDVTCHLEREEWNGVVSPTCHIRDIQLSELDNPGA